MSWKVWVGKKQEEIRHLRGLIDEIMVICDEYDDRNNTIIDWTHTTLSKEIMKAIEETQHEYEGANEDE